MKAGDACYNAGMAAHFSTRLPWPSPPNALSSERARLLSEGRALLNLVEANPSRVGLSPFVPGFLPHEVAAASGLAALATASILRYEPDPRGLLPAREALTAFLGLRFPGHDPAPDRIFLAASTSEAYSWLFKLLAEPGDAILVPKPGYPLFDYLAGLEALEPRRYGLAYAHPHGWRIDLDSLAAGLEGGRARAIVLINPNNPTGSFIAAEERRAILELAGRHGAALIVDEVFFGFPLESRERSTFLGEEGVLTFVLDGLSKLLCLPQMKLGWIAISGPRAEVEEATGRLEIVADTYLSAGTPVMRALPAWLGAVPALQTRVGERLAANLSSLRSILEGPTSPHRVLRCEGGWTALVEAPRVASEDELALGLMHDEGLIVHPGYYFDMEREAFFALSLILEPAAFTHAARRYAAWFERILSLS